MQKIIVMWNVKYVMHVCDWWPWCHVRGIITFKQLPCCIQLLLKRTPRVTVLHRHCSLWFLSADAVQSVQQVTLFVFSIKSAVTACYL